MCVLRGHLSVYHAKSKPVTETFGSRCPPEELVGPGPHRAPKNPIGPGRALKSSKQSENMISLEPKILGFADLGPI